MASEHGIDTAKLSTHVAQRAVDRLLDFAEAKIKEKWAQHKNRNTALFAEYMQTQSKTCAQVRTLISDKQSGNLLNIYVPLRVNEFGSLRRRFHVRELTTHDIINLLGEERDEKRKEKRLRHSYRLQPVQEKHSL